MKTRLTKHARFLKAKQLADQGNVLGAAKIFRALQVDDPGDPQVKLPLAVALFQLGDYDGTIKVISEYIDLMPEAYFTHQLRGRALSKLDKFESALVEFNLEIKKNPSYPEAHCDKAYALIEINRCEEGLVSARLALELDPNLAEGYDCMAIAMNKLDKPHQAIELAKKAININRLSPDFHRTLGDIFYNLDDFDNALKAYDKSLNLDNHFTITEFQKSKVYLSTCNFNLGWQAYESRHKLNSSSDKNLYQNFSKIHLHEIKKILIRKEQGIGDQILFSSLFFEIDRADKEIYVEVDDRLITILSRSFKHIKFFDTKNFPNNFTPDITLGIGSLGGFLRQSIDSFQNQKKYFLRSDPIKKDLFASRLNRHKLKADQKICGVSWRSKNNRVGMQKSIDLKKLRPILSLPDVVFVNLQYNVPLDELAEIKSLYGIEIINFEDADIYNDIDSLCGLIDACDFVITTSNVTAHISGGLGKKTYLLVPKGEGKLFYWHHGLLKSLWYPSVEIFKQHNFLDWGHPVTEVRRRIKDGISKC